MKLARLFVTAGLEIILSEVPTEGYSITVSIKRDSSFSVINNFSFCFADDLTGVGNIFLNLDL